MNAEQIKTFEKVSGWIEYANFERQEEGYITQERIGDATCYFIWRVDKEPARLDAMYIDGAVYVRYNSNAH